MADQTTDRAVPPSIFNQGDTLPTLLEETGWRVSYDDWLGWMYMQITHPDVMDGKTITVTPNASIKGDLDEVVEKNFSHHDALLLVLDESLKDLEENRDVPVGGLLHTDGGTFDFHYPITQWSKIISGKLKSISDETEVEDPKIWLIAREIAEQAGIDAEFSPDAENLLSAAVALLPQKEAESEVLSTTTLFLTAIEWGLSNVYVPEAPKPLTGLAQALVSLSEGRYEHLRSDFFGVRRPIISFEVAESEGRSFSLSDNVRQAVKDAAAAATGPVSAVDLVRSVLSQTQNRLSDRLAEMELSASVLETALLPGAATHAANDLWTADDTLGYAEYARAIYHFLRDPRTTPPLTISIQAPWGGGKTSLMRMIQRELDPIGYQRASDGAQPSISSPTGASAQDLLKEIICIGKGTPSETRIDMGKSGGLPTIWFNAWIYQSGKQIWAGLGEAIVRNLCERLDPVQREKFLLRLHLARVNPHAIRLKIYEAAAQQFYGLMRGSLKWILALVVVATAVLIAVLGKVYAFGEGLSGLTLLGSTLSGAVTALFGYASALWKAKSEPAKFSLSDYLDVPDYGKELGFVHQVNEDLRRVLDILPFVEGPDAEVRRAPIVLFIDDLDRCSPTKVAEVFEAINLFIAGEFPNCYVILGMDSEIVAAALEEAHKHVVARLPAYSRQTAVGWRYMDKFVQLPFLIPPIDADGVKSFARHLAARENLAATKAQARAASVDPQVAENAIAALRAEADDPGQIEQELADKLELKEEEGETLAREILERDKRLNFIDARAELLSQDSREIEALLEQAHMAFSNNPRELKRLVNVYRFYINLRLAREARGQPVPTIEQTRNWVMLMLAWPEFYRWLRRSNTEWETEAEDLSSAEIGRLLQGLEQLAVDKVEKLEGPDKTVTWVNPTMDDWTKGLEVRSGLNRERTPWLSDERLFRFFQRIATGGPDESLAAGAGRGFW